MELQAQNEQKQVSVLDTQSMGSMMLFAEQMAKATFSVPEHLRGNVADCLAVTMQAVQWGMNPFLVAGKTHLVNGVLGFEAQLVSAVITQSNATVGRFKYRSSDGWEALAGKVKVGKNHNGKRVPQGTWTEADEALLWVQCGAVLNGEESITWGQKIYFGNVMTRNSPLWVTAPEQQMMYLAVKYWSRIYTPDVILGVYDKESLEEPAERREREINPTSKEDLNAMFSDKEQPPAKQEAPTTVIEPEQAKETIKEAGGVSKFDEIKQYIGEVSDAGSYQTASEAFNDAAKNKLCTPQDLQVLYDLLMSKNGG